MKKWYRMFVGLLACCLLMTGCQAESQQEGEKETLTVAMELAYPPFETKDSEGNPAGISVDFAKAFGEYAGYDIQVENMSWDGLIPSLQTGKADMVISSMTITEERKETVDFSDPLCQCLFGNPGQHRFGCGVRGGFKPSGQENCGKNRFHWLSLRHAELDTGRDYCLA